MKYIQYFCLLMLILGLNCDATTKEIIDKTTFVLSISGDIEGKLTQKFGRVEIKCDKGRTIISFFEKMDTRPDTSDLLIGEIHLGVQMGDSTGTYALQGITERREQGHVGFLALLNSLEFDDLSAQYIQHTQRFQKITEGSIQIEKWSSQPNGVIKGNLEAIIQEERNIEINGRFTILLNKMAEVCDTNN